MQSTHATPQLWIIGNIVNAVNFEAEEIFIKYEVIFGSNFKLIDGKMKGETFQGTTRLEEKKVFFDHPIMLNLSCRSLKGWPKLFFEVWGNDEHNRNSLIGYGTTFIPFKKGNIKLSVPCWRPIENMTSSLSESLLGNTPEFIDKSAVYSVDDKFGLYAASTGSVNIELDIIMKDFNLHGIQTPK